MFLRKVVGDIPSYCTLVVVVLISTLVLWLPFFFRFPSWFGIVIPETNFQYIYRHFDGLLYIVPAKALYDPAVIEKLRIELPLSPLYFAAHFPLYPLLIRTFAPLLGYLKSMLFVNLLSTAALVCLFWYFLTRLRLSKQALFLSIVFLFLPRFLVVRSVGAPESLFMLLVLTSLYFFEQKKYFWAGLMGALSVVTRSPGILLFVAYCFVLTEQYIKTKKFDTKWLNVLLIPGGLIAVFVFYGVQYQDMWAYFKSGDNIHLMYPFAVFNYAARWVGTAWLEEVVLYFFIYLMTVLKLRQSPYRSLYYFSLVYFVPLLFIQHLDIGRYALPLWPMTLIAYEDFFTSKNFKIAFVVLMAAIYFYAWNFMTTNVMPVSDWSAYL